MSWLQASPQFSTQSPHNRLVIQVAVRQKKETRLSNVFPLGTCCCSWEWQCCSWRVIYHTRYFTGQPSTRHWRGSLKHFLFCKKPTSRARGGVVWGEGEVGAWAGVFSSALQRTHLPFPCPPTLNRCKRRAWQEVRIATRSFYRKTSSSQTQAFCKIFKKSLHSITTWNDLATNSSQPAR